MVKITAEKALEIAITAATTLVAYEGAKWGIGKIVNYYRPAPKKSKSRRSTKAKASGNRKAQAK